MADEKTVTVVLPSGSKVTCTEELASRIAPAEKAPAKKAAPKTSK